MFADRTMAVPLGPAAAIAAASSVAVFTTIWGVTVMVKVCGALMFTSGAPPGPLSWATTVMSAVPPAPSAGV